MIENLHANPKALNLNGLSQASKKVTIGFKCDAKVKLALANAALERGITLSEHVENLVVAFESVATAEEIQSLQKRIQFYENETLLKFYNRHLGETINFQSASGDKMSVVVKAPKDIYTILINSFKLAEK